jgi:hypothetical protein
LVENIAAARDLLRPDLLVSTRNGEPLAFINDGVLQQFRVGGGAASA